MSTFAVFGMSRHRAVELARTAVKPLKDEAASEWEVRVQAAADATMQSDKSIQLSEKFDAPQFADKFLEIAKRDGAVRLHMKAYCQAGVHPETKRPIMHWTESW